MAKVRWAALGLVTLVWAFAHLHLAQAQVAVTANRGSIWAWDAVTVDVNGAAESVGTYDLAVAASGVNLNTAGATALVQVTVTAPKTDSSGSGILSTLKNGTYSMQVRARDLAGNVSVWGTPVPFVFDGDAPAAPGNLRKL